MLAPDFEVDDVQSCCDPKQRNPGELFLRAEASWIRDFKMIWLPKTP